MSSKSGPGSYDGSGNRSPESSRGRQRDGDRPWLKRSRSRSPSPRSRSRSPRHRSHRSRSPPPHIRPINNKDPKYLNSRVFVANIASDKATDDDLHSLFGKHGKVIDAFVHPNGYGFVQFTTEEEGRRAVEAETGTYFHGKNIKCNMAAEGAKRAGGGAGRGGGRGGGGGAGRGGIGPPDDNRFGREHSPGRDPFGPPFDGPYARGRDLPPPARDLPPPPRDLSLPPRDLPPLPPRDPFYDDPYRRPLPPAPYYDRFRPDHFRRSPYGVDPYRDPYRDPYDAMLYDPAEPKKPVTVDCAIIIMTTGLRHYAEMVQRRLKDLGLLTSIVVMEEDLSVQQQVEEAARRSCLFAVVINAQNEMHCSLTLNILYGIPQEHRNMPLDDALSLVSRSFDKFLQAEKEKVKEKSKSTTVSASLLPPKDIVYLLNLLADAQQVTVEEIDKVMAYLNERKDKMLEAAGITPSPAPSAAPLEQPLYQQQQLQQQLLLQQQQQQQQLQQMQQQQELLQQKQQHKEIENKILSMMNGSASLAATTQATATHSTVGVSRIPPVLPVPASAGPPPAVPQPALPPSHTLTSQNPLLAVQSPTSVGAVRPPASSSTTLINFDNPTVQKALDNLIQSGSSLLKNISQPKSVAYSAASAAAPQRPPY